ncbi:hypothetical protein pb186bvf_012515 [Paramecium bursaria]
MDQEYCKKQGHEKQLIIGFCLNPKCTNKLTCSMCILDVHKTHRQQCYLKEEFIEYIKEMKNSYNIDFNKLRSDTKKVTSRSLDEMKRVLEKLEQSMIIYYDAMEEKMKNLLYLINEVNEKTGLATISQLLFYIDQNNLQNLKVDLQQNQANASKLAKLQIQQIHIDYFDYEGQILSHIKSQDMINYFHQTRIPIPQEYQQLSEGQKLKLIDYDCKTKIYYGQTKDQLMHGEGLAIYASVQVIISGVWKNDEPVWGQVWYITDEQTHIIGCYESPIVDSKANGLGVWYCNAGHRYVGHHKDNRKDGHGVYYFDNGDVYDGNYKDHMKHGTGKYTFKDKYRIEGTWVNDRKEGQFKHFKPDESEPYENDLYIKKMIKGKYINTDNEKSDQRTSEGLEIEHDHQPHYGNNCMFLFKDGQPSITLGPHWPLSICLVFAIFFGIYVITFGVLARKSFTIRALSFIAGINLLICFLGVVLKNPGVNFSLTYQQPQHGIFLLLQKQDFVKHAICSNNREQFIAQTVIYVQEGTIIIAHGQENVQEMEIFVSSNYFYWVFVHFLQQI